jgi:hypothetical protein
MTSNVPPGLAAELPGKAWAFSGKSPDSCMSLPERGISERWQRTDFDRRGRGRRPGGQHLRNQRSGINARRRRRLAAIQAVRDLTGGLIGRGRRLRRLGVRAGKSGYRAGRRRRHRERRRGRRQWRRGRRRRVQCSLAVTQCGGQNRTLRRRLERSG